ncbi:hypothetical protein [Microcoleus sp.]|uniref:hypothetical protein n=1 Tax=Microcoleus sp. TaxID=44472 RepID=UPI00352452C2
MGNVTLPIATSIRVGRQDSEPDTRWRDYFPSAHQTGVGFGDLPKVARSIADILSRAPTEKVSQLVSKKGMDARIDYNSLAEEFNSAYWLRNFIKCLAVCRFASTEIAGKSRFMDFGGGGGPFSLAAISVSPNLSCTIYDESPAQEAIFVELLQRQLMPRNVSFQNRRVTQDLFLEKSEPRLLSYFLCENRHLLCGNAAIRGAIGDFSVVVDYLPIVRAVADSAASGGWNNRLVKSMKLPLDPELSVYLRQEIITISGGVFWR